MCLRHLLFQPLHALIVLFHESFGNDLVDMLFVVVYLLDLSVQRIFGKFEFLSLLSKNLVLNLSFETEYRLLEQDEESARAV